MISGNVTVTAGETVDRASLEPLPPASVIHLPAGLPRYAHADVVVQINGVGPFDVVYLCGQAERAFWHAEEAEHLTLEVGELCLEHLHGLAIVERHVPIDKAGAPVPSSDACCAIAWGTGAAGICSRFIARRNFRLINAGTGSPRKYRVTDRRRLPG